MTEFTDEELVEQIKSGEHDALEELVSRYTAISYRTALSLTQVSDTAEDIVQESFVKVWKKIKTFKTGMRFRPWLLSIVYRTAFDAMRKQKGSLSFSELDRPNDDYYFEDSVADESERLDDVLDKEMDDEKFKNLLSLMPVNIKEILLMRVTDGLTFEEIARIQQKSLNTVKSQYRRAIIALKNQLDTK